ncbi:2Fe-2S iron-sulfur cluster binding domain-containing protein [Calidifontibacter sp. DB0510]|uniref:2Fe-2S iron-sulfur cluster binding domain-containing protein n=1 Tax=Metallococcus carri TaxID=1656884 RepID=A0A967B915_9MICO|nr:FAD binding domain-containing protein [Metallococcus carri]NHN57056.1 2Fe-2S iron-sulfur cluster binding domain-containing protein [Metallococcus carri]NOP39075.1 2Fe-2S iron-sulfur cluster binding domain-containing protein [Calidifontibacter sp. DB2511S]
MTDSPTVSVNGTSYSLHGTPPWMSLLDFVRSQGLTGAKEGCAEGECGACSVLVVRPDGDQASRWTALNACLTPAVAFASQEVVTSEGLGEPDALHPVQHEMAVRGGSQCGYCTPGFICSMASEYYRPGREGHGEGDAEHGANGFDIHSLSGNLCRCTGYRPIRDAAFALGSPETDDRFAARCAAPAPAHPTAEVTVDGATFLRPGTLDEALAALSAHPDAVLVAGSTDWGVEANLRGSRAAYLIGIDRLDELRELTIGEDAIQIGAALTLSEIERQLEGRIPLLDKLFPQFASRLIRNGATIGGNLGTGSPIGDTPPALLALEASLVLAGPGGERTVPLADYFTGYRQTVCAPDELIKAARIPLPLSPITAFHKIAKRRFDDISSVAVGLALETEAGVISKARIGLGGVAATPIRALATEAALEGSPWSRETFVRAAGVLREEGTPMDDHRASSAYRKAMLGTALLRLHRDESPQEATA